MPPKPIINKETNLLFEFFKNKENKEKLLNKFLFNNNYNNHYVDAEYYEIDENTLIVYYNDCDKELIFSFNFKHTENKIILLEFCQPNFNERYGESLLYIKDSINKKHKFTYKIQPVDLVEHLKNYL